LDSFTSFHKDNGTRSSSGEGSNSRHGFRIMLWALEVLRICSFSVLIMCFVFQLPPAQLENALTRTGALKAPLIAHASQPNIRSSLPRFIRKFHFFLAFCKSANIFFLKKKEKKEIGARRSWGKRPSYS